MELSDQKQELLKAECPILVLGGPGSGKTTIALFKAKEEISQNKLKPRQKVLFLSFARATVTRVAQGLQDLGFTDDVTKLIEINTYHGFTWSILKSHGYLLNGSKTINLLPPPEAASTLAEVEEIDLRKEKERLFFQESILHFDLFAYLASELLSQGVSLAKIICDSYPYIILDEFQDTNMDEWKLIQILGAKSKLIALADANQRIYEFRGADPARIGQFIKEFDPIQFDFENENNRSNGTDIVQFGNDLLVDKVKTSQYQNVSVKEYPVSRGTQLHLVDLKTSVLSSLNKNNKDKEWSLAVLVPTKKLMLEVSNFIGIKQSFKNGKSLPSITHEVALEKEGPSLSAVCIASLLENSENPVYAKQELIQLLIEHIRGRKKLSKADLVYTNALKDYLNTGKITGKNRINTIDECEKIAFLSFNHSFTGDPSTDWIAARSFFANSNCKHLRNIAYDAEFLRLLKKGSILQSGLSEIWRDSLNYQGAVRLVKNALLQEHFSSTTHMQRGVNVMTMHKSKGKEFSEVIIYEGLYNNRIVFGTSEKELSQAKLKLRVAVTRAMENVTIYTPQFDPCPLL
jgi:DNA helicase-2/ATP-dependent DNA helicase PcrA